MPRGDKTKKIRGTDLSAKHFLYVGCPHPRFWLLPVCDPTSAEKTRALIARNLDCWEEIKRHIPLQEHRSLRAQLEGAAQSYGIHIPEVTFTDAEMRLMMAERFAARTLDLVDLEKLYA
jgi:hypothetical protein